MTFQPPQTTVQGYALRSGPGGVHISKTVQGMQSLTAWRDANTDRPDHWLCDAVSRGFQKLLLLRLDGAPAAELVAMTAELWVDTIGYGLNEEQDRERIVKGFNLLQGKIKKWPQPVELMASLPTRMKAATSGKDMEAPISDEAHAKGVAAFEEILENLK